MVVRAGGEIILEISGGLARGLRADEGSRVSVSEDTSFQILSASKPVVAFATAVLEDRGLLDVNRSVSHYVPEFGRVGKSDLTILDVLTHRSGVLVPSLWTSPHLWPDWARTQEEIWRTSPRRLRRSSMLLRHSRASCRAPLWSPRHPF